jgi:hypothetical protein
MNKNCIFTCNIANYDSIPVIKEKNKNWDYKIITDNKDLKSSSWEIIYIENVNNLDKLNNTKLSRFCKTNYHVFFSEYDNYIYIDSRCIIINDLNNYVSNLGDYDFLFLKHPQANNIKEEMDRVLIGFLESQKMIDKIKKRYEEEGYKYNNGLFAGGILCFKGNERVINFFNDWWYEIKNYSHRDQLSLNFALSKNNKLKYKYIDFNLVFSKYFKQGVRKSSRLKIL